jgi:hypothetical protein
MAQIIAPTSVLEWGRVLTGTGVAPFGTLKPDFGQLILVWWVGAGVCWAAGV